MAHDCDEHAWASIGVTRRGEEIVRVPRREACLAWSAEPLEEAAEVPWEETVLADR